MTRTVTYTVCRVGSHLIETTKFGGPQTWVPGPIWVKAISSDGSAFHEYQLIPLAGQPLLGSTYTLEVEDEETA